MSYNHSVTELRKRLHCYASAHDIAEGKGNHKVANAIEIISSELEMLSLFQKTKAKKSKFQQIP